MQNQQRRDFMKIAATGAAGMWWLSRGHAYAAWPSTGTMAINPNIDNLRVVACCDPAMLGKLTSTTFSAINSAVKTCLVHANLDAMAMQLANVQNADAAWKTIFRSSKPWSSTTVAIKVNGVEPTNMARLAIVEKFCRLFAGFGVPASNIIVYDGSQTNVDAYKDFLSATDSTKIPGIVYDSNSDWCKASSTPIPSGWVHGTSASCVTNIANGSVDIIVNIANNKGHDRPPAGAVTLTMKNHFGTFAPCVPNHDDIFNYLIAINKSDALIGGNPPRQQLCVVDSLTAMKGGPAGMPDTMPCYLIMGVFAPAVDYLTVKKVREEVLKYTGANDSIIDQYLTSFGYKNSDASWILVPPVGGCNVDGGAPPPTGGNTGTTTGGSGGSSKGTGGTSGGRSADGSGGAGGSSTPSSAGSGGTLSSGGDSGASASRGGSGGGGGMAGSTAKSESGGASGTAVTGATKPQSTGGAAGATSGTSASTNSGCNCEAGGRAPGITPLGAMVALASVAAVRLARRKTTSTPKEGPARTADRGGAPGTPDTRVSAPGESNEAKPRDR